MITAAIDALARLAAGSNSSFNDQGRRV
jgi:hypothetical protein